MLPLSCSRSPQSLVLATVGERQITADDFKKEIERRHAARRPIPDKETLLREMVDFEALLQRARAAGLMTDPLIQREINSLLVNKLKERELTPQETIAPTPEEVRAEYEKNLAKFTRPAKVRLAVLALAADARISDASRAELRDRMAEAREKTLAALSVKNQQARMEDGGSRMAERQRAILHPPSSLFDFGPLAIDYSDDQASRYRGGDVGWLDAGNFSYRWPRQVLETGYALEKNRVSEVIETKEGVYLVMKTDSRPGSTVPFAEAETMLRQGLIVKKRGDLEARFREQAARQAHARINARALATLEIQLPSRTGKAKGENLKAEVSAFNPQPSAFPLSTPVKHP